MDEHSVIPESQGIAQSLVVGSIAGLFGKLIEHPFDTIKVRLQTTTNFTGFLDCLSKTVKNEGVFGLYKGNSFFHNISKASQFLC
jgi:solute carrier family 25 carnitine/acylcarnitine transporter 20/29